VANDLLGKRRTLKPPVPETRCLTPATWSLCGGVRWSRCIACRMKPSWPTSSWHAGRPRP